MKKLYCIICGRYGIFEKPKISYQESIEILKTLGLIESI